MRDLFSQATELPTAERISFVQQTPVETDLRTEIISLLHADECQKKKPITGAICEALEANVEERRQKLIGSIVGHYRLSQVIGHGGTGTVYLAERIDAEGNSKVAIKIVESAAINGVARRRFRDERQILANLSHPNIARLFDAGDTRDGYPYLVMDYVEGEPIDRYCDRHRLTIRQRIELFLKVCDAVEYAHRNLIIHRDLKPQNILVMKDGTPKLLDFGIAKLLAERAEPVEFAITQFHDQLLTPTYASPEQVLGKPISTTTDVYTLGVVLYELLTGVKPFNQVEANNYLEYENLLLKQQPQSPSAAIKSLMAAATNNSAALLNMQRIGASRGVSSTRLQSLLKGDIDTILLHALRPQMADRYKSVEQFANDLGHFLSHRPVHARKGGPLYYANRFIRAHVFAATAAACFVLILATTIAVILRQSHHISFERDQSSREKMEADTVVNFMANIFGNDSEYRSNNAPIVARDLLDRATAKVHDNFPRPTMIKAKILESIANGEQRLGMADRAIPLLEEAVLIQRQTNAANSGTMAHSLGMLGKAFLYHHQPTEAKEALYEALSILENSHTQQSSEYALLLVELGRAEQRLGKSTRSRHYLEQALPLLESIYGPEHPEVGSVLTSLGFVYQWQNEYDLMEKAARKAVNIYKRSVPALHPDRLMAEQLLAEWLFDTGQIDKAAPLLESIFVRNKKIYSDKSFFISHQLILLAKLRMAQHRFDDAETLAAKAVNIKRERLGNRNYDTAYAQTTLAMIHLQLGKYSQAEIEVRTALSTYNETLPTDHPYIESAEYLLAEISAATKRPNDALKQSNGIL